MKALTIFQPWASLLACGAKKFETRSWATRYRGKIAIHSGVTQKYYGTEGYQDILIAAGHIPSWIEYLESCALTPSHEIPFGAIIATAELVGCYKIYRNPMDGVTYYLDNMERAVEITGNELYFGDFTAGRYAWEFRNMVMLPEPIPVRGYQRLWEWDEGV